MIARRVSLWAPFLAALAVGFCLSSIEQAGPVAGGWDKLAHAIEFTVFGVLAMRAFHGGVVRPRPIPTLVAGLAVVLWGISDEFHQSFVPGRDATAGDVVADTVGFAIAVALILAYTSWTRRDRSGPSRSAL